MPLVGGLFLKGLALGAGAVGVGLPIVGAVMLCVAISDSYNRGKK